jgi:coenzyme F420-0:L-glutamate ligase
MRLIPIKMPIIKKGDDIINLFFHALEEKGYAVKEGDIIAFADKVIAMCDGRYVNYEKVKPSKKAKSLAEQHCLEPGFVELVIRNADAIYGGVPRALLTLKNDIIIANAGIDHKNVPKNFASMWPSNPDDTAAELRDQIEVRTGKKVGVILVDSHVVPMRMGTLGFALGIAGFKPIKDCRGMKDLYGKPLLITRINIADDVACAAHFLMGETDERISIVILRNTNIEITNNFDPRELVIPKEECIFMKNFIKSGGKKS